MCHINGLAVTWLSLGTVVALPISDPRFSRTRHLSETVSSIVTGKYDAQLVIKRRDLGEEVQKHPFALLRH